MTMKPELLDAIRQILEPLSTTFDPIKYVAVRGHLAHSRRRAALDWANSEFRCTIVGTDAASMKEVDKLGAEIVEIGQVMFRLDLAGAPVRK